MCPVKFIPTNVEGHKDRKTCYLNLYEQLNTECNLEAKAFASTCLTVGYTEPIWEFSFEPWPFWICDSKISWNFADSIIDRCDGKPCLDYWSQEKYFPNDADSVQDADWDAIGDAITAMSLTHQKYVIKHSFGFCGVNK
jgi:hypothetical protein